MDEEDVIHTYNGIIFVAVDQLPSHIQLFATPWTATYHASLSHTISWSLPKFMSIAGEGNGTPIQYSHLENPVEGGAW